MGPQENNKTCRLSMMELYTGEANGSMQEFQRLMTDDGKCKIQFDGSVCWPLTLASTSHSVQPCPFDFCDSCTVPETGWF